MRPIKNLVVHCSATPAGKPFRAADIDRWHRSPPNNWKAIGYHYVICLDGSIEPGRDLEEVGSHVAGHNTGSIGICLIGGVDAAGKPANTFNARQFAALEVLLHGLRAKFPGTRILGHRDFPNVAKACPSFDVASWCSSRGIKASP